MRIGKFLLSDKYRNFDNTPTWVQSVISITKDMAIIDCRYDFPKQGLLYTAYGNMFDDIPEGSETPTYVVNVSGPFVTFNRVPSPNDNSNTELNLIENLIDGKEFITPVSGHHGHVRWSMI